MNVFQLTDDTKMNCRIVFLAFDTVISYTIWVDLYILKSCQCQK